MGALHRSGAMVAAGWTELRRFQRRQIAGEVLHDLERDPDLKEKSIVVQPGDAAKANRPVAQPAKSAEQFTGYRPRSPQISHKNGVSRHGHGAHC